MIGDTLFVALFLEWGLSFPNPSTSRAVFFSGKYRLLLRGALRFCYPHTQRGDCHATLAITPLTQE